MEEGGGRGNWLDMYKKGRKRREKKKKQRRNNSVRNNGSFLASRYGGTFGERKAEE